MRYSESAGCFYPEWGLYETLPEDLITVSEEDFRLAMGRCCNQRVVVVNGRLALEDIPGPTLVDIKASVWEKIKAERDKRMDGGFRVGEKWFHSDQKSRVQHLGLLLARDTIPPIQWKTMDGTFQVLTPSVVMQIFEAAFTLDTALFTRAEQHKAAMEASPDPAVYDFSTGWPENFYGL